MRTSSQRVPRPSARLSSFQGLPRISKCTSLVTSAVLHFKPQSPVISLAMEEALPLLRENSSNSYRQSRCYIPARYVLAALSCSGFCVVYLLRVNLSVALVAMVNSTYANEQASANNPECQRNSSTDSEKKVRRKGV